MFLQIVKFDTEFLCVCVYFTCVCLCMWKKVGREREGQRDRERGLERENAVVVSGVICME